MLCDKCKMLATGGSEARGHADLAHVHARFRMSQVAALRHARTDQFKCTSCSTNWEVDFDPSAHPNQSAFRQVR